MRQALGATATQVGSGFLDLLYPPVCLHCGARISSSSILCISCRSSLEVVDGADLSTLLDRLGNHEIDRISAVWYFDRGNPLQDVQHALKYGNRPACGVWLGRHLRRALERETPPHSAVVVPIPLHRRRLLTRGFNQSAIIGRAVADTLAIRLEEGALSRPRSTRTQVSLSRADRRKNLSTAFATPHTELIKGRCILLVDDVMTTGATLAEAAAVLKTAGADTIWAAAVGLARH